MTWSRKPAQATARPLDVEVVRVEQKDVSVYSEWIGTTDGMVNAEIKAYKEGSYVKKGQLLFEMRNTSIRASSVKRQGKDFIPTPIPASQARVFYEINNCAIGGRMVNPETLRLKNAVNDQDHMAGPASAVVTLLEYGNFECIHCGRAYLTIKQVRNLLSDDLRFVFRHFPTVQTHPHSLRAAEAAEAAGAEGKFLGNA